MAEGWIKLYRCVTDNWFWKEEPFSFGQAWIDLLLRANHEAKKVPIGNEIVVVPAGSFITSELKLMDAWKWSKSKTRRFLKLLESDGMIIKKTDHKKTTISIVNWGKYQMQGTKKGPMEDRSETDERPIEDTNKNDKNEKNVKNNTKRTFVPPSLEEVKSYCEERHNRVDPEAFIAFYNSNGWRVGRNKMKSWKSAIITWEKRNKPTSAVDDKLARIMEM